MLSATVPNTLEFADWVGRTKKKQVFVLSTPKRPVPLEHYLYLGFNQNVNTRMHLILDASNTFISEGYLSRINLIYFVFTNYFTASKQLMSQKWRKTRRSRQDEEPQVEEEVALKAGVDLRVEELRGEVEEEEGALRHLSLAGNRLDHRSPSL